jgi:phosphoglycerate dehydrogenase-like enzyme
MTAAPVRVLVEDVPQRSALGPMPDSVELVAEPAPDVELLVLGLGLMRQVPALFEELPGLRLIQAIFAGVDGFVASVPPGVVVCSASGAHDIGVAEWVVATLLALRRRLPELLERQRHGEWDGNVNESTATGASALGTIDDLDGSTILVLGYGSIGRAVAARLQPFGARVVGIARHAREDVEPPEALERLLPQADAVVVLLPLTAETERIVDAAFLARMKPGAVLVNAARGRHVDTAALLEALRGGRIRAALDVTDPEPLPPGHPLWSAPNLLITPHLAGGVRSWQERAYRLAGDQIRRYVAGEPLLNVRAGGPGVPGPAAR